MDIREQLRERLHLNQEPWLGLPDELLAIAFRPASADLTRHERDRLTQLYGTHNLETFEFLGDAVIELLVTDILFDEVSTSSTGPGQLSQLRQELVRNTTLYCLMQEQGLCEYIEEAGELRIKTCADVFEALIGVLYYYLNYLYDGSLSIQITDELRRYLQEWWFTPELLDRLYSGELLDQMMIDGQTARERGNNYVLSSPVRQVTISELEQLQEPFPIAIRKSLRYKTRSNVYLRRLREGGNPYDLLRQYYSELRYKLTSNTFVVLTHVGTGVEVALRELDFQTGTLRVIEVATGPTFQAARDRAAYDAWERLM